MADRKLCFSITFDQFYIEPALLTAYEIINSGLNYKLHLVYIEPQDESISNEMENILLKFKNKINNDQLIIIKVDGILANYKQFHFTNAIIYKILIPSIIKDYNFVLNLDAGILLGNKFSDFIHGITTEIDNNNFDNSLVSAFCTNSQIDLHTSLHNIPHNSNYPSGIVMLFNVRNYDLCDTSTKIISTWNQLSNYLVYAEQDLLCIIAEEGQLTQLPMVNSIVIEYLDLQGLNLKVSSIVYSKTDFSFYKVCGTCKPWKYFVLDFRKLFYLNRRAILEKSLDLSSFQLILRNRHEVTHKELAFKFLENFEKLIL